PDSLLPDTSLCKTAERRPMPLGVILSEVSNANEIEGSRTADELARSPEDQRDEGSSSRKRSRYRFPVREALLSFAMLSLKEVSACEFSSPSGPRVRVHRAQGIQIWRTQRTECRRRPDYPVWQLDARSDRRAGR